MGKSLRRINTHRTAKQQINSFYDDDSSCLIVHYSCESFYDIKDGRTPRITSIAIRDLKSAQTKSFSIHKIAELKQMTIDEIDLKYDELEKEMLKQFYVFVKEYKNYKWIHWNMRDINYGFEALKHRATILGAKPIEIKDEQKYDLARLFKDKYGTNYSDHPRLESILKMNNISSKHWLNGDDEAAAFENKNYVRLHQSTLSKVEVFESILKASAEEKLKTKSTSRDIYGLNPQGLFELAKDHWFYSLVLVLLSGALSAFVGYLLFK